MLWSLFWTPTTALCDVHPAAVYLQWLYLTLLCTAQEGWCTEASPLYSSLVRETETSNGIFLLCKRIVDFAKPLTDHLYASKLLYSITPIKTSDWETRWKLGETLKQKLASLCPLDGKSNEHSQSTRFNCGLNSGKLNTHTHTHTHTIARK